MHSVNIEMIQFLVVLVVRDDSKSPGAHPDPEVFLKGLCGIERPYLSTSHLYKPVVGIDIITGLRIYVAEIVRQFGGAGPWIGPVRRALHVVIEDNIPAFSIDVHSIFIERPRMELLCVLITALLPIDLNAIVFRDVGLFVLRSLVFTMSLSIVTASYWAHLVRSSRACLQRDLITNPVRHDCPRSTHRCGGGMIREQVGEKREQVQMTDRDEPMSTPEVPTINGTSRVNKGRQQREGRRKTAKKRGKVK